MSRRATGRSAKAAQAAVLDALRQLPRSGTSGTALARLLGMTQETVSRHLRVLEADGRVLRTGRGVSTRFYLPVSPGLYDRPPGAADPAPPPARAEKPGPRPKGARRP